MVAETDAQGNETAYYTLGDERINMEMGDTDRYYLYDGSGSVRYLSDATGSITDRYSYDAYGNLLEKEGDTKNDFLYRGEQYNANTSLYYLRARYMDPSTGMFISMDSYPGSLSDPVSLHKYLYANANPVMYSDPSGYKPLQEYAIVQYIKGILIAAKHKITLHNVMRWVNAASTIYDTATEIKEIYENGGDIGDVCKSFARGWVTDLGLKYMCKGSLGVILRPVITIWGATDQVSRIKEDIKEGDWLGAVMGIGGLTSMAYAIFQQCFTGDTLVSTEHGLCRIDTIEVGDYVWSQDTKTGEKSLCQVLKVFVNETDTAVHVTTESGSTIKTTENHPFYVEGKGWVAASELQNGDILRTSSGKVEAVTCVEVIPLEKPITVYNLEIEGNHTYYVSAEEVLVHNMCRVKGGSATKDIYRAVGVDEYYDIMDTGRFRGVDGSLAAKEFGNDFNETLDFANRSINKDKVAIIKVTIPEDVYNQLHHMNLDAPIFKSGTPVVEPNMLDYFNNSILNIEHVY